MDEVIKIINDIKKGIISPIYFLSGDEPYFIDQLSDFIEQNILTEEEKSFNQTVFYGRDVEFEDIISTAKRFPMMAEKQVVIVKEAQDLWRDIEKLVHYANNPMPSTILVFCVKYKKIDKRKGVAKVVAKSGVIFESKKLYENQIIDWIRKTLQSKKYSIEPKAAAMLVEFLGTDLSKINKELEKLQIILAEGTVITPQLIEINIGISKDYNVFELRKAIAERNQLKAYKIVDYFANNQKANPIVVTTGSLFNFFIQVLKYHGLKDKNPRNAAAVLGINPYFLGEFETAARNYPMRKVSQIISDIREMDAKSKGFGTSGISVLDLLRELLFKVFN